MENTSRVISWEHNKPHLISQKDLEDLLYELKISKAQAEILISRLKGWNLLEKAQYTNLSPVVCTHEDKDDTPSEAIEFKSEEVYNDPNIVFCQRCNIYVNLVYEDPHDHTTTLVDNKETSDNSELPEQRISIQTPPETVTPEEMNVEVKVEIFEPEAAEDKPILAPKPADPKTKPVRRTSRKKKQKNNKTDKFSSTVFYKSYNLPIHNHDNSKLQTSLTPVFVPPPFCPDNLPILRQDAEQKPIEDLAEKKINKRTGNPEDWEKNVKKKKRNSGESYVTYSGKLVHAKKLKPPCGEACRLKCNKKFNEDERQILLNQFWKLGDITKQRNYIFQNMKEIRPKNTINKPHIKRAFNVAYFFRKNNDEIRVCKQFFMSTLDIGKSMISTTLLKISPMGVIEEDRRGKQGKPIKTVDQFMKQGIWDQIRSYPKTEESHSAGTSQQYVDEDSNISMMYNRFKEKCINGIRYAEPV